MDIQTPSKQKIINAIIELLAEKSLGAIKVSEITVKSGVSNQTFYRVFMDKYDACECACFKLLSNAAQIVGVNSTVKEHTACTLNIVKTNKKFFRRLLSEPDGIDVLKKTLVRLSEEFIEFHSNPPIMSSWIFCLQEWSKNNFTTPIDDVYIRILSCYPVDEVVFGEELYKVLEKYGNYTMNELNTAVNARRPKKNT